MSAFEAIYFHETKLSVNNITKKSTEILIEVLKLLDTIEPEDKDGTLHMHSFWLRVERGSFDEWIKYASKKKEFEGYSGRKLKQIYNKFFNKKTYWIEVHACHFYEYKIMGLVFGDYHITINNLLKYHRYESSNIDRRKHNIVSFLRWFKERVLKVIDELKNGTYNDFIAKNLPYTHRLGTVSRSVYLNYFPEDKEQPLRDSVIEEDDFISMSERKSEEYIPKEITVLLREKDLICIEPRSNLLFYSYEACDDKILRRKKVYNLDDNPFFKEIEWIPIKELKLKDTEDINNGN